MAGELWADGNAMRKRLGASSLAAHVDDNPR
jgi:hypothetical protein